MNKILLIIILILIPTISCAGDWTKDDLYLFSAVISSQLADYSQSVKFNQPVYKTECNFNPQIYFFENGYGTRWYDCQYKSYLSAEEKNPLVRRGDGGFDSDRAIILTTMLDTSVFYISTKYPKWRKPLLYLIYAIEITAIQNNHNGGFVADTPILPVFFTWHF